jgi:hypothetical protein
VQPVAAAEEREEVVAVLREERERVVLGVDAGEDRRDGVDRPGIDGRGVSEPRGVPSERREARVPLGVDLPALVEERRRRDLVEDEDDHGYLRVHPDEPGLRIALQHEVAKRRGEEEEAEEDERCRPEHGKKRASERQARVRERGGGARQRRGRQGEPAREIHRLRRHLEGDERDEAGDAGEVDSRSQTRMG